MGMSRLLSLILPNRQSNLSGDGGRNRRTDSIVREPLPIAYKNFSGMIRLTRPSSPSAVLVSENNFTSKTLLNTLPLEIRQQIWVLSVGGGRTFHFLLVEEQDERRFRAAECSHRIQKHAPEFVDASGALRQMR